MQQNLPKFAHNCQNLPCTIIQGRVGKKIILKIKIKFLRKTTFQKKLKLHGEKENFEEYSLNLEYAKLPFPILNHYLVEKHWPCP
jgi:hypothetical protein